jgi:hypothetical protein
MRPVASFVAVVALALASVPVAARPAAATPSPKGDVCGARDLPETGIQGDVPLPDQLDGRAMRGYNCGLDVVGHNDLGRVANANMAWVGHCAFVAGTGSGVAVIDVSDPRRPRVTETLHGPGSDFTLETINARAKGDKAVLVAGRYGPAPLGTGGPIDIYDVHDCTRPRFMSTITLPTNVHNLTITADLRRVFSTLPLQVADISDLRHPRFLGNMDDQIQTPTSPLKNISHEAWISDDGSRLYIGGQVVGIGEYFTIADISHWPARPPRIISQVIGRGHSVRPATINGHPFIVHSEESIVDQSARGCVPARLNPFAGISQPWLMDVTDERHPFDVGQFRLAINEPSNCAAQSISGVNGSVHYHDVDDPKHSTFMLASMWNSGLRVADIRDPAHPREVAYFNPGMYTTPTQGSLLDQAWAHVRYVPSTGQIWLTTMSGGFWVLELEPQVRHALALPARPSLHPDGAPPRTPAESRAEVASPSAYVAPVRVWYCTLAPLLTTVPT